MDDIKELVLLTKDEEKEITTLLNLSSRAPEKLLSFYTLLKDGELHNDIEAAQRFFDDEPSNTNYQKLKSDLLRRLIIIFFSLNVKDQKEPDRRSSFYRYYFRWATAVNLIKDGAETAPFVLIREIYEQARKYEFTDLALAASEVLSEHYLDYEQNLEQYEFFQKEAAYLEEILDVEDEAELLYAQLAADRANQRSWSEETQDRTKEAYERIKAQIENISTYRFRLCAYLIESGIFLAENDYEKVNRISEEAIQFFFKKPYDVNVPLQIFFYQKLLGHIQLRQYEKGKTTAQECLQHLEEGTYNWFKFREAYFLLLTHTGNFKEAFELLEDTCSNERYTYLPENIREVWNVYTAYVSLLVKWRKVDAGKRESFYQNYEVEKLLGHVSIYSKDKEGMNVALTIIHLLHLVQAKEYDILLIREEALKKYTSRYLKGEHNARSALFVKLLLLVPHRPYEPEKFEQKAQKILEGLNAIPFDISKQSAEIEIIPFEQLWHWVRKAEL